MIPFLAGLFTGLALGVVIGLHAVYRQSGVKRNPPYPGWQKDWQKDWPGSYDGEAIGV